MKAALTRPLALLSLALGVALSEANLRAQDAELTTRPLKGVVKFTNTNLEILNRLGPPGNEGISSLSLRADSLAPTPGIAASVVPPVADKLENPYDLILQAGTNDLTAIPYSLQAGVSLDSDRESIYLRAVTTPALVAGDAPVTVDIAECVGLVELRFVNAAGEPVPVDDAGGYATADTTAYLYTVPPGSTSAHMVVPSGSDLTFVLQVRRGTNLYENQLTDSFVLVTNVPCDEIVTLDLVLRGLTDLGRIVGNVDMQGEFEWTTEGVPTTRLLGRTAIFASGPASNQRWDFVAGDNETKPASGAFELENLLPSDAEDPPLGWRVWAELHFRANRRFEYLITPQLAHGLNNPGALVAAGQTVDLGDTFVLKPAYISGSIVLAGPPDTAATKSALRGVQRPDDIYGTDSHGIPNVTGIAGINQSHVIASGVDRVAAGATLSASGGQAYAAFPGDFNPLTGAFEGDYELVVGGLKGEASVWQRDLFRLALYTPDLPDVPYVNQGLTIIEKPAAEIEIPPGMRALHPVRYGFSEVCIRFRSSDRPFYSPRVVVGTGVFDGTDFVGRICRYETYIDGAYGPPLFKEQAGLNGLVTLYLPQGTHTLPPFVTVLNDDGTESITGLNPIQLTVGARQRLCVEACLQVEAGLTVCADGGPAHVIGHAKTCGQAISRISYRLNDGEETTICENCGADPTFNLDLPLPEGNAETNIVQLIARDVDGGESFLTSAVTQDTTPPVVQCPADIIVSSVEAAGTRVDFTATATDNSQGPVTLAHVPASGTVFPWGTNLVTTTATDICGNTSTCTFNVVVLPPTQPCFTVTIDPPACTANYGFLAKARVASTCGAILTNLSLRASPVGRPDIRLGYSDIRILIGARESLETAHGLFAGFDGHPPEFYRNILYTATAIDNQGRIAAAQLVTQYDTVPPVINCPADLVLARTSPCGARPFFEVTASDACSFFRGEIAIVCDPPAGSLFPVGETVVKCSATDFMGNRSECSFKVTVTADNEFALPTVTEVIPATIANEGDFIIIRGLNFTSDDEVLIDGEPLLFPILIGQTEIGGRAPALSNGSHVVSVRRCGVVVSELPNGSTTGTLPHIVLVDPPEAFAQGGNRVSIVGADFTAETKVRIAFPAAADENLLRNTTVSADGTIITGEVPPLPADEPLGPRAVTVFDARGEDLLPNGLTYLPNPEEPGAQLTSYHELQAASSEPPEITVQNGVPVSVSARVPVVGETPEPRARDFLNRFRALYRQDEPDVALGLAQVISDDLDHVSFDQYHRGLPVFGANVVVSLQGNEVVGTTGLLVPTEVLAALDLAPILTDAQAAETAREALALHLPMAALEPVIRLEIFAPVEPVDPNAPVQLVWHVSFQHVSQEVLVDARTSQVVLEISHHHEHGGRLDGFRLDLESAEHEANAEDDLCFNLSNDSDAGDENGLEPEFRNDPDANAALLFARETYGFFHERFNWHSYDNAGTELEIFVHSTISPAKAAAWSGGFGCEMIEFGAGQLDFEVMVHEFTHAIIEHTSRLVYQNESGALNEHYADVMAMVADRERGDPENGGINWLLAENRLNGAGAVRNFQTPSANPFNQPEIYTNRATGSQDKGRVHANSGIPNKAAYLMSEGGDFNGVIVRGMGLTKLRILKWEALRTLGRQSTMEMARNHEVNLARAWAAVGTHGFGTADVCTVLNAWAAVAVGRGDFDCDGREDDRRDTDNDGVLDYRDNCRTTPNTDQRDADGDKRGDVCDNCRNTPNFDQADLDYDGIGDVCDPDRDNDGCLNSVDQHPDTALVVVGQEKHVNCSVSTSPHYQSESGDTDLDGVRDCEDLDDDNDGIPDDRDNCPIGGLGGIPGTECTFFGNDCPLIPNDWYLTCLGGGCVEYYARITDRINPDPTRDLILDRVTIINDTVYVAPNVGNTIAQTAARIAGRQFAAGRTARADALVVDSRRMEIWTRATPNQPARLVTVVGEFNPADLQTGDTSQGTFLAFKPANGTNAPTLNAVWHLGEKPTDTNLDLDGDGLPDGWERQHGLNPANPADATLDSDGDGLSNAAEFTAGTDPQSGASRFAIEQIQRTATGAEVHFAAPVGRRAQLERTASLANPNWQPVGQPLIMHGSTAERTDPNPVPDQAFFRLRLLDQ